MTLNHLVADAPLYAGDKEPVIFIQGSKPGKIKLSPVHDGDGTGWEFKELRNDKILGFGAG